MVFYWNTAMVIIWVLSKVPHCSRGRVEYLLLADLSSCNKNFRAFKT